jgi:hypothetical protein
MLATSIEQLWPSASLDTRTALVEGLGVVAFRRHVSPRTMFNAVLKCAESGYAALPSVGRIMQYVDAERARTRPALPASTTEVSPPWWPMLTFAMFVESDPSRAVALDARLSARLMPWRDIVRELSLTWDNLIPGTPTYDPTAVASANEQSEALWDIDGGIGPELAIELLAGVGRRGATGRKRR